jgi:hypothetical protein
MLFPKKYPNLEEKMHPISQYYNAIPEYYPSSTVSDSACDWNASNDVIGW